MELGYLLLTLRSPKPFDAACEEAFNLLVGADCAVLRRCDGCAESQPACAGCPGMKDLQSLPMAGRAVLQGGAPNGTPCPLLGAVARLVRCLQRPWFTAPVLQRACRSLTPRPALRQVGKARWAAQAAVVSLGSPGAVNVRMQVFAPAELASGCATLSAHTSPSGCQGAGSPLSAEVAGWHWQGAQEARARAVGQRCGPGVCAPACVRRGAARALCGGWAGLSSCAGGSAALQAPPQTNDMACRQVSVGQEGNEGIGLLAALGTWRLHRHTGLLDIAACMHVHRMTWQCCTQPGFVFR